MIYTSNYARCSRFPNAYAISVGLKEWNNHLPQLKEVAPTWEMVTKKLSEEEYTRQYLKLLELRKFNPYEFVNKFSNNEDHFLLCYESPNEFCHRRILAEYIYNETGIEIPEWKNQKEIMKDKQQAHVANLLEF